MNSSELVFGAWSIGGWFWGEADLENSREALAAWIEAGRTWVDTAPIYGFGLSETIVGEFAQHLRIATKCGLVWADPTPTRGRDPGVRRELSAASIRDEAHASLRRLGVERIDLYQCHWPDEVGTPIDETMDALVRLREAGDIAEIGVSNFPVELLEATRVALDDVPLFSTQPRYSALDRDIERDILPWCRRHDVRALVYSPLESGLLTGQTRTFPAGDRRASLDRFSAASQARIRDGFAELEDLLQAHDATPAQLVLAWTLAQPGVTAAVVGARNARQARENARAAAIRLGEVEVERVANALAKRVPTQ